MTLDELKSKLTFLLGEEEEREVDWTLVEHLSLGLQEELRLGSPPDFPADLLDDYLSGFARRREDPVFAQAQRSELVAFLRR
jgi:hypothetical protein